MPRHNLRPRIGKPNPLRRTRNHPVDAPARRLINEQIKLAEIYVPHVQHIATHVPDIDIAVRVRRLNVSQLEFFSVSYDGLSQAAKRRLGRVNLQTERENWGGALHLSVASGGETIHVVFDDKESDTTATHEMQKQQP